MKVSESKPTQERTELIAAVTGDAAKLLGVDLDGDPPKDVMKKVNDAIVALVFGKPTPVAEDENPDLDVVVR